MLFNRPSIPTVKRQHSLLDRRRRAADRVIATMRDRGLALHVSHEKSGDLWCLSDGSHVAAEAAKLAVAHPDIINVGDGLFGGELFQSWRFIDR